MNLLSSLLTKSLFENKKLIIISRATDKLFNLIKDILEREINQKQKLLLNLQI